MPWAVPKVLWVLSWALPWGQMGAATFLRDSHQKAEKRDDPLAALVHILTGISEDPVVEWLEGSPDVRELRQPRQATDPFVLLERIAHSAVETLRNQVEHEHLPTVPDLARWLVEFTEAVRSLQGLNNVPPGAGAHGHPRQSTSPP